MSHRAHLSSLGISHAMREVVTEGYSRSKLIKDVMAGMAVGVIAIPLALALAIASGVAPQYGLYTAIVAGLLIALTGGSRFSVSGPTAAFVVILHPLVTEHGLQGLLVASLMSGIILMVMAYAKLGRVIEYIPESVTLGFTGGIAIVIATLQVPDLLGLSTPDMPASYAAKITVIGQSIGTLEAGSLAVAIFTLGFMVLWPKLKTPIPAHLPAVVLASVVTLVLNQHGFDIATIGSRFHYVLDDGTTGSGIPAVLPHFELPWLRDTEQSGGLGWTDLVELMPAAFAIAMLGAIESLLCAVVLDGMSGKRHSANSELLGQGIGNIVTPFFGGITATAAIARSAANFKAGAQSPVAAMVHAIVVLLTLMGLASLLQHLPMPALAAMLLVVAWGMSEAPKAVQILKKAPRNDIAVFVTCISLTVWVDMVIAITAGIVLASILFMREIASMTKLIDITENKKLINYAIGPQWKVFDIKGPLFFAAADRIFSEVDQKLATLDGVILHLEGVSILDAGGLSALSRLIAAHENTGKHLYFSEWQFQPLKNLAKAKIKPTRKSVRFFASLDEATQEAYCKTKGTL